MLIKWKQIRWATGLVGLSLSLIGNTVLADVVQTARLHHDTNYGAKGECHRQMYVYRKAANASYKPIMLLTSGGWVGERPPGVEPVLWTATGSSKTLTQELVDRGYVVFIPYYRVINNKHNNIDNPKISKPILPQQDEDTFCRKHTTTAEDIEQDVKDALLWIDDKRSTYSVSNNAKIQVMGFSAGGHLALSLAFASTMADAGAQIKDKVGKIVAFAPPSNLSDLDNPNYFTQLVANGQTPIDNTLGYFEAFAFTNVSNDTQGNRIDRNSFHQIIRDNTSLRNTLPPMILLHGFMDSAVSIVQSIDLCLALGGYPQLFDNPNVLNLVPRHYQDSYRITSSCNTNNKFYFDYHHYLDHGAQCLGTTDCAGVEAALNTAMIQILDWL